MHPAGTKNPKLLQGNTDGSLIWHAGEICAPHPSSVKPVGYCTDTDLAQQTLVQGKILFATPSQLHEHGSTGTHVDTARGTR